MQIVWEHVMLKLRRFDKETKFWTISKCWIKCWICLVLRGRDLTTAWFQRDTVGNIYWSSMEHWACSIEHTYQSNSISRVTVSATHWGMHSIYSIVLWEMFFMLWVVLLDVLVCIRVFMERSYVYFYRIVTCVNIIHWTWKYMDTWLPRCE
jgi:hypothetical protein